MKSKYGLELARKAQLIVEAQVRVTIESQVYLNPRYETVFEGLKKNHPHNVALVHPMSFLLRRIVYAVIIIFLFDLPYIAASILIVISVCILAYVITEH